jgi:hypothetical protein
MVKKPRLRKVYLIREGIPGTLTSRPLGWKMKYRTFHRAQRLVKRLKRIGRDAYMTPDMIRVWPGERVIGDRV